MDYMYIESYENNKFLYYANCNTIFEYNDFLEDVFSGEKNTIKTSELQVIYQQLNVAEQIKYLDTLVDKYELNRKKKKIKNDEGKCHTLWLNIAHECNLNCIYCYGEGGNYNKQKKLMDVDTAKKIIDFWVNNIDKDKKELKVIFFGGEPLINKAVLIESVSYINYLLKDKFILKYGLTTNVTLIDNEILKLFRNNHFNITLSIDGGKDTQDRNRPYKNGKGSFNIVKNNLNLLKDIFPILTARMTLTHPDVGKATQLVEELWSLGISNIALETVETNNQMLLITKDDLLILEEQISILGKLTYKNIIDGKSQVIIDFIKYGKVLHNQILNICSFYDNNTLKIDPDGDIFKCHRLIGEEKFRMGNLFNQSEMRDVFYEETTALKCTKCWAKNLCIRCPEANYIGTGDIKNPKDTFCLFRKMVIFESLRIYVSLFKYNKKLIDIIYS